LILKRTRLIVIVIVNAERERHTTKEGREDKYLEERLRKKTLI
jgi:hypothetical protein